MLKGPAARHRIAGRKAQSQGQVEVESFFSRSISDGARASYVSISTEIIDVA